MALSPTLTRMLQRLQEALPPEYHDRFRDIIAEKPKRGRRKGSSFEEFDRDVLGMLNLYLSPEIFDRIYDPALYESPARRRRKDPRTVKMTLGLVIAQCWIATPENERQQRIGADIEAATRRIYGVYQESAPGTFPNIDKRKRVYVRK